jgi:hypothetical protein
MPPREDIFVRSEEQNAPPESQKVEKSYTASTCYPGYFFGSFHRPRSIISAYFSFFE